MPSTTVRISDAARQVLRDLAEQAGTSMQDMLEKVIEDYRRRHFFDEVNAAYGVLREKPEEWQAELDERKILEGTLADDLDDR